MFPDQIQIQIRSTVASHHRQHVEAGLAQKVPQVGDGGVGGDVGGEPPLPLRLGQLEGAAQLVQRIPAHHGADEDAIRLQNLLDLKPGAQALIQEPADQLILFLMWAVSP